jgi:predicted KAP-like P-loop ATPase
MKSTPELKLSGLHPRFLAQIPALVETASETRNTLRPMMKQAESLVSEVKGFVEFEIDKAVVAIEKAEWEARSDTAEAKGKLEELRTFHHWLSGQIVAQPDTVLGVIVEALGELSKDNPP